MYKQTKRAMSQLMVLVMLVTAVFGLQPAPAEAEGNAQGGQIEVWDFGGVQAAGDSYINHITVDTLNGLGSFIGAGWFRENTAFGDLTVMTPAGGGYHRLYYYDGEGNGALSYGKPTTKTFSDGYVSKGSVYSAGNGDASAKYIRLENVKAGDKITVYGFVTNGSGPATVNFALNGSTTGEVVSRSTDTFTSAGQILEYHALDSGTLQLFYSESGSYKPNVARITRTPGVTVSGALDLNGHALSGHSIVFQNQSTGELLPAELAADGTYTAALTAGYTYNAVLRGVGSEYAISDTSKTVAVTLADLGSGIKNVQLNVVKSSMAKLSGTLSGFESGYSLNSLKLSLVPPQGSLAPVVEAVLDTAALTYSADLRAGERYTLTLSGVNDYVLTGEADVNISADRVRPLTVAKAAVYNATGAFTGLPSGVTVSSIKFTNLNDGYSYTGNVTGGGYSVKLRDGAYAVTAVCSDPAYTTAGHTVVKGEGAAKDLKFSTSKAPAALPLVQDLYVGDSAREHHFGSVKEALAAAARMNPSSEAERITIHIAPGTYRAQLKIATPYISLVNADPGKEVKITWYYGVGYDYYSAGPDGLYNEDRAFDKYLKGNPGSFKWGATVFVTGAATGFRAENIVFENSFNKYITEEELEDGVEVTTINTPTNLTPRTASLDARSRGATERAAAIAVEADQAEFYKCKFLSNQDTLFTGNTRQYYKDSFIEGNTDYIFGSGNVVFDNSTLNFAGYSDQDSGGHITAAKPSSAADPSFHGYLFRDSTVTGSSTNNFKASGDFGRPWGQDAKVTFLDTRLENSSIIYPEGWAGMGGSVPEKADFYEYNTTYNGVPVDTSARKGKVLSAASAVVDVTPYFGADWVPHYYEPGTLTPPVLQADSVSESRAIISWQGAVSSIGSILYEVYQNGQKVATTTEATYAADHLAPLTSYTFKVNAVNTAGNTAESNAVEIITAEQGLPAAPVITAESGGGNATISWSTVTGATYYTVKGRSAGSDGFDMLHTVSPATVTSYTYSELTNGTVYHFVVSASNEHGEGPDSNEAAVTPEAGTAPGTVIKPEDFTGFDIGSPGTPGSSIFDEDTNLFTLTGSGTGINKNATGLDQFYMKAVKVKGDYTISAKAVYSEGQLGAMSLTLRESLDPNSYHYTQAATATGGRKMFRYSGSSNGSNSVMPVKGTAYLQITKTGDKIVSIVSTLPIPANPVASETLAISTATAKQLGLDENGNPKELYAGLMVNAANASSSLKAVFEDVKIVMADGTVLFDANAGKPVAPKNIQAKPYNAGARITWDALNTATSYTVQQSISPEGPFTEALTVGGSVYEAFVTGLENDRTYYFAVTAKNASGESVPSQVVSVSPTASADLPPVLTMTSAEPAARVFSALLPLSGTVDKESSLTIRNNGIPEKWNGTEEYLLLHKGDTFSAKLILVPGLNEIEIKATDTYGNETVIKYTVTYTYRAGSIGFYDTQGQAVTVLEAGREIWIQAEAENYIADTKDVLLFIGLYDEHNNLIKFISTAETLYSGETDTLYARLRLPDDVDGYTLKAFVWDNMTDMQPVSETAELQSN
ncbi:pectinesterase family protein [Paenibacillus sp. FSL R7-0345]|uniref:pectinesterase family protein n=1 Tax=Paenibacillus sp. FSL R7-0345 TaxID=2954535 RepID=UPI003159FCC6